MFAHPLFGLGPTAPEVRTLYLQNLVRTASIGVYQAERQHPQRVRLNLALRVVPPAQPLADELSQVLDYAQLRQTVLHLLDSRHWGLQETLCDAIATLALSLPGVQAVYVSLGKLDAVDDCEAVGCELLRVRP